MSTTLDPAIAAFLDRIDPKPSPYLTDPVAWCADRIGAHLWSKQREIAMSLVEHKRTAVHSCHGVGKSYIAAAIACWWIDVHKPGDALVASTAPRYDQVHLVLWEEIRKMHRRGGLPGEVNQADRWNIGRENVGVGRKPADTDEHGFQGLHRPYLLAVIDEACGVPDQLWAAVEAITTSDECRILAIGNPDSPDTQFARVCDADSGWNVIHIDAFDSPNFTGEQVPEQVARALTTPAWAEDALRSWGEDSAMYQSKVRGRFTSDATSGVVPSSWISRCRQVPDDLDLSGAAPNELGVDPAAGGDESVIAHRLGNVGRIYSRSRLADTMHFADEVCEAIRATGATRVKIDSIGVGKGVADAVRRRRNEHGATVVEVNVGRPASEPRRFARLRDELWWMARELSETGGWVLDIPDDAAAQLAAPRWGDDLAGRVKVESKDELQRRGIDSPDLADALNLAFYASREPRVAPRDQAKDRSRGKPLTAGIRDQVW